MTVHFIGAGPGAADLLTLRGRDHLANSPVCLYAGSLVPREILSHAPTGARIVDTAEMNLDEIIAEIATAHTANLDVARIHSGDLSIWSTMAEQLRRLRELCIPYDITPGVPAFAAAAAALEQELTLPHVAQTVILTRTSTRSTPMPHGEDLATLGRSGATLAIHLSIQNMAQVTTELLPSYGADCPVVVVFRASWPDQQILRGTLSTIQQIVDASGLDRNALILVGKALGQPGFGESFLYSAARDRAPETKVYMPAVMDNSQRSTRSGVLRVLILGGTAEAAEIAARLEARSDLVAISSLAGRVSQPKVPDGLLRVGGFGGVAGLVAYLRDEKIGLVIDATHPFAVRISSSAEAACHQLGLPLIALARTPWTKTTADRWHAVADIESAASWVAQHGGRVFLAVGRQQLQAFSACGNAWFLIRAIDPPDVPLPPHTKLVLDRGPFHLESELQLLRDHAIDSIVCKNSGGLATYPKIEAARMLGIPVVMVERPGKHTVPTVDTVARVLMALSRLQEQGAL